MFRNLNAEQARLDINNTEMGRLLGISRVAYERKKKSGAFSLMQAKVLSKFFGVSVDYLFETQEDRDGHQKSG